MSTLCVLSAGCVLAEQTVLAFAASPPSAACSPLLPGSVCEGGGGETKFAMNQKTQLQFNLGVVPNQAKLATQFSPSQPSPVTIHKMATETIGISHTSVRDFTAVSPHKLALAMKLAKRNARVRSAPELCNKDTEDADGLSEEEVKAHERRPDPLKPAQVPPKDSPHKDFISEDVRIRLLKEYMKSVPKPGPDPGSIARELRQLKLELDRTMQNLCRAKERKGRKSGVREGRGVGVREERGVGVRMVRPASVKVVDDRICWEDLDESEEREQQRRDEQMTRNTRMMYDLAQQVRFNAHAPENAWDGNHVCIIFPSRRLGKHAIIMS